MARYVSDLRFACPICGEDVVLVQDLPEPDWAGDDANERARQDEIDIMCPSCESTEQAEATNLDGAIAVKFVRYPSIAIVSSIGYTKDDDDFFDWYDTPDSPRHEFERSIFAVEDVLVGHGSIWTSNPATRMIFAYYFSAFESYLSDALINHVMMKRSAQLALLKNDKVLASERIPLHRILEERDVVWRSVRDHLADISYHNFPRVEALYRCACKIDIWPNDEVKKRLYAALPLRHDIVHRNGVTKDGRQRQQPDRPYLSRMAGEMLQVVAHIDQELERQSMPTRNSGELYLQ